MSNITLIIPTYRNPKCLDLCLKSAVENRSNEDNQIMVIVDGFIEESQSVLEKYKNVLYLPLDQNQGMQYALNVGVMQAPTDEIFIINDDNVLPKEWDVRTLAVTSAQPEQTVVTVDQVEPTGPSMFKFDIRDFGKSAEEFKYEEWLKWEELFSKNFHYNHPLTNTQDGRIFPFAMRKKYYMAVGGFDVFYNSPNVCDWDFFLKLEILKFKFIRTHSLHLYHFGSVATKKNAESQQFRDREARAFSEYEYKWGSQPFNGEHNTKINPIGYRGFKV